MHDGMQKFSKELVGVFIRTVTTASKSIKIVNIPWFLNQLHGGSLNTEKLVEHLLIASSKSSQFKIMILKKLL